MRGEDDMNYLWEVELEARKSGIKKNNLRFYHTTDGSAYMELALDHINQDRLYNMEEVGVNTYYRFYSIFKDMFRPEFMEYGELRKSLTNLILHVLAENDVRKGMTREEYNKKLLLDNIMSGCFGKNILEGFTLFCEEEQQLLLSGWLRLYRAGSSLTLFTDMVRNLIRDSIVYHGTDSPNEILIYTGLKDSWDLAAKFELLIHTFLDIRFSVEIFYQKHFGILGIDETMMTDEIAMY